MADSGIPLHVLQQILGHQSIETTRPYLHPDTHHLTETAKQANAFLAGSTRKGTTQRATPGL
jgi:site-specific recombinase XerD